MKKRMICWVLLISVLLSALCGCGKEDTSAADAYLDIAQGYIDEGNYSEAMSTLKKGYDATEDSRIAVMMAELSADKSVEEASDSAETTIVETVSETTSPQSSVDNMLGIWAVEDIGWENGGLVVALYDYGEEVLIDVIFASGISTGREAYCSTSVYKSDLEEGKVSFYFDDDGWWNSGRVTLSYQDASGTLRCEFANVTYNYDGAPMWGFYDDVFDLCKDEDALNKLHGVGDETFDAYWEEESKNWTDTTPVYDTSKASGILASLGITEEEFRNSCVFLTESCKTDNNYREIYPHVSIEEIKAYPNNYVGMFFAIEPRADRIEQIVSGTRSRMAIEVSEKGTTSDGYYYYTVTMYDETNTTGLMRIVDMEIVIIDMRDDVYSPCISSGDKIIPYMIFGGMQNDIPVFEMISVDVFW